MTNPNDPAFSKTRECWIVSRDFDTKYPEASKEINKLYPNNEGLTKREYFAAMAMQGIIANPQYATKGIEEGGRKLLTQEAAIMIADALIKELSK